MQDFEIKMKEFKKANSNVLFLVSPKILTLSKLIDIKNFK